MQIKLIGLRKELGVSQKDMASLLGITQKTYCQKENGKTEFLLSEMFMISEYFKKSVEEIFLPRNTPKWS